MRNYYKRKQKEWQWHLTVNLFEWKVTSEDIMYTQQIWNPEVGEVAIAVEKEGTLLTATL